MEIEIFRNPEFGEVRTLIINNEPYFVSKDVALALGYENPQKAVRDHVDIEDKVMGERNVTPFIIDSLGRVQYPILINESGLYSLILCSKLPEAKKFKHWITQEVLPSIRKNGGYIANQENLSDEELLTRAVLVAQRKIAERDERIKALENDKERMKPKEIFADAVATSKTSILVGDLAKMLRQNGIDIGGTRLFEKLRNDGYLIKRKGTDWNMPTQKAMDLGLFEIKEHVHLNADGVNVTTKTPKVTGKGQVYFINKFLGKKNNSRTNSRGDLLRSS